jgi:hypothetical protein
VALLSPLTVRFVLRPESPGIGFRFSYGDGGFEIAAHLWSALYVGWQDPAPYCMRTWAFELYHLDGSTILNIEAGKRGDVIFGDGTFRSTRRYYRDLTEAVLGPVEARQIRSVTDGVTTVRIMQWRHARMPWGAPVVSGFNAVAMTYGITVGGFPCNLELRGPELLREGQRAIARFANEDPHD